MSSSDALLLGATGDGLELITLRGISARGHHGYYQHERDSGQTFVVDLTLQLRRREANDELDDTADYGAMAAAVVAEVEGEPVDLIETLAHRIAAGCLAHRAVVGVVVTVHKPEAPMPVPVADSSVTVVRTRR